MNLRQCFWIGSALLIAATTVSFADHATEDRGGAPARAEDDIAVTKDGLKCSWKDSENKIVIARKGCEEPVCMAVVTCTSEKEVDAKVDGVMRKVILPGETVSDTCVCRAPAGKCVGPNRCWDDQEVLVAKEQDYATKIRGKL